MLKEKSGELAFHPHRGMLDARTRRLFDFSRERHGKSAAMPCVPRVRIDGPMRRNLGCKHRAPRFLSASKSTFHGRERARRKQKDQRGPFWVLGSFGDLGCFDARHR